MNIQVSFVKIMSSWNVKLRFSFFQEEKKAKETGNKATDRSNTKSTWFVISKSCRKKRWESQGTIKVNSLKMYLKFENTWTAIILDYPKAIIPESEPEAAWVERQAACRGRADQPQTQHSPGIFQKSAEQGLQSAAAPAQPSGLFPSVTLREDRRRLWSLRGNRKLGTSAES